jgi:hypothetical protein
VLCHHIYFGCNYKELSPYYHEQSKAHSERKRKGIAEQSIRI